MAPPWLPDRVFQHDFHGFETYLQTVYEIFRRDFIFSRPEFRGRPVAHDKRLDDGKEVAFWHIVSEWDYAAEERLPQPGRCEPIAWVRAVIENEADAAVHVFPDNDDTLLWLRDERYLVVLRERFRVSYLVSAYPISRAHTHEKLDKKLKRWQAGLP